MSSIIQDYFSQPKDYIDAYNKYINKKQNKKFENTKRKESKEEEIEASIYKSEIDKYNFLKLKLKDMLKNTLEYSEQEWQIEISKIVLLLFPKYFLFIDKLSIETNEGKRKELDIVLIDTTGNIDIIEIKKPQDSGILSGKYRNNYKPSSQLSGTIIQTEKYIYHLNTTAKKSEEKIKKKILETKNLDLEIHIRNPKGIIIMGRTKGLEREQLRDFEIIKRQYNNIIDIMMLVYIL